MTMNDLATAYLDEARRSFRGHKRLAEGAIAQVSDDQLFHQLDPEANSIAIVMKHIAGNQRSRFTDFLTTDGEKPNRHRDTEFEMPAGAAHEPASHQSPGRALCIPRRTDRPACETPPRLRVEDAKHRPRPIYSS